MSMNRRSVWAVLAVLLTGLLTLLPFSVAQAQQVENPLKNIAVTGSGPDGTFKGTFDVTE